MTMRQVVTLFVFVAVSAAMLICLPLRMVHPLLRIAGIPNDYLPMDIIQRYVHELFIPHYSLSSCSGRPIFSGLASQAEALPQCVVHGLFVLPQCYYAE